MLLAPWKQEIYAIIKGRLSTVEQAKFEELSMLAECLYQQEVRE